MTEDQLILLRDKHTLWTRAAREGDMELRDYNRRMAEALGELLAEHSAGFADAQDRRWRPASEAPADGTWIEVRQEPDLYRWLTYKPDGARQMKKAGRWQRCVWRGDYFKWENAELPEMGWRIPEPPEQDR